MKERFYDTTVSLLRIMTQPFARTQVEGLENIPETGKAILVPNHVSILDPVLLGTRLAKRRYVRALAKDSLFRIPVVGNVLTKMGQIPVFRNTRSAVESLQVAVSELQREQVIVVYPEGTIPTDLTRLGSMKSGAARLALLTGAPIIPIAQWGAQTVIPRKAKMKSLVSAVFKRPYHKIVIGEPLESLVLSNEPVEKLRREDIVYLTKEIEHSLEELLLPLRGKTVTHA